ncbi:AraC family transcriptional regulator [Maribacter ulvicola]|uniref:Transcriptional regulator, AraC family n=1 Tax=Maribacter ulvicola TaxID=228959 RepID=A0A1N7ANI9_9FLAO|nr:AraC family transcriptional regulator [Maribacter ulvicola]SIR40652.1 transcriptional regulator, AraC family [Maribacter ulvicola]
MKAQFVNRTNKISSTLSEQAHSFPHFFKVWHYHTEVEIILIKKSTGVVFLGNDMKRFQPGDIFFIGSNVPHMWQNDQQYYKSSTALKAESLVIHFDKSLLGSDIFRLPEAIEVGPFLKNTQYAIKFNSNKTAKFEEDIRAMFKMGNFEKVTFLLKLLFSLSKEEYEVLGKGCKVIGLETEASNNMDKVYDYIYCNFKENIALDRLAELACMNKSSFCRYFKKMNHKTVSRFVNELRIGYACQLLQEQKYSITSICYESGFYNISNFNRQFRNIMKASPSDYVMNLKRGESKIDDY